MLTSVLNWRVARSWPGQESAFAADSSSMTRVFLSWVLCTSLIGWPAAAMAQPQRGGACLVAEFKTLALSLDDVPLRTRTALAWLQRNISRCSQEQLSAIKSNSPSWLGHALTAELSGLIEGAIEAKISGNPALMGQLYESLGKEGSASVVTTKNPTPRAPVVQPPTVQGGLVGSANYGNVIGPSTSFVNQTGGQNTNQNSQQMQGGINNQQLNPQLSLQPNIQIPAQ